MDEATGDLSVEELDIGSFIGVGRTGPEHMNTTRVLALARDRVLAPDVRSARFTRRAAWVIVAGAAAALLLAIPVAMSLPPSGRNVLVVSTSWAYAYSSLAEIAEAADLVVIGTVERTDGTLEGGSTGLPSTLFAVSVERAIKGQANSPVIQVVQAGGHLSGSEWAEASDYPLMREGDHVMLFLNRSGAGSWTITGEPQGRLMVANGEVSPWPGSLALPIPAALPIDIAVKEILDQ
jgi:hypothetical protein